MLTFNAKKILNKNYFMKPEFGLEQRILWKLEKPLYRPTKGKTTEARLLVNICWQCWAWKSDIRISCFLCKHELKGLVSLRVKYADDTLHARNEVCKQFSKVAKKKFKPKDWNWDNMQFFGTQIETKNWLEAHQNYYTLKLTRIKLEGDFSVFLLASSHAFLVFKLWNKYIL